MSTTPTFLFVPGNFLPPIYYSGVAKVLGSHSFPTQLITLPSTGSNEPLTSNEPDIAAVRTAVEHLSNAGKEIVIVAHSYGAIPACEAVKGLGKQERHKAENSGGVVGLVFVAAWLLREGESPPDVIGRNHIESPWARFDAGNMYADDPASALHNDTTLETAAYWAPYTTHSDLVAFATPLKYAAWRSIPTTYVICELDRCIPPSAQEDMVKLTEGKVKAVRLDSGHMPMLSMPERLAEVLMEKGESS